MNENPGYKVSFSNATKRAPFEIARPAAGAKAMPDKLRPVVSYVSMGGVKDGHVISMANSHGTFNSFNMSLGQGDKLGIFIVVNL